MSERPQSSPQSPQRVVILGGGPAGVAAAYWLSHPLQQGKYQVTLCTQGWRLGGKCATGRDLGCCERIEEHGLHVLMGCYQNAFTTIRDCYAEWRQVKKDPRNPLQTWRDGFLPQYRVSLMEREESGSQIAWQPPWNIEFPPLPGWPGDGTDADSQMSHRDAAPADGIDDAALILRMAEWLNARVPPQAPFKSAVAAAVLELRRAIRTPRLSIDNAVTALTQAQISVGVYLSATAKGQSAQAGLGMEAELSPLRTTGLDFGHIAMLADLCVAIALGYLLDIFGHPNGYETLNAQDYKAWLRSHGATAQTSASAPVRAFYDLAFATVGDAQNWTGSIAAGVSLRAQLEMAFGYRGAPLWKTAAGTGDTVFTPFYDVLVSRGVRVEFFNRVTAVRPTSDGQLGEIDICVQALTQDGSAYQPLIRVKDLDCWPDQPLWSQLKNGDSLRQQVLQSGFDFESSFCRVSSGVTRTLTLGEDFDLGIVAMPPDALRPVTTAIAGTGTQWQLALQASSSVATLALQLWVTRDLSDLGWPYGSTILTAFAEPFDSWGDMSHLIPMEGWTKPAPQTLGYFCGRMQLSNLAPPREIQSAAQFAADHWVANQLPRLWPKAGLSPWQDLGIVSVYCRANTDLSERYVATPGGQNVASRFDPSVPAGLSNLYVIGDWTKTRFSGGCFESAVESAMLAARGISGFPPSVKTAR